MGEILGIIALLVAFVFLLQFVNTIIHFPHLFIFALAVSMGALLLVAWVTLFFQKKHFLRSPHVHKMFSITADTFGIRSKIDRNYLNAEVPIGMLLWISTSAAVVAAWVVVFLFHAHDKFYYSTFIITAKPGEHFFFSGLLLSITILVLRTIVFEKWLRAIRDSVLERHITRFLSKLSNDVNLELTELHALQTDIDRLCGDFGVDPCRNFLNQATEHLTTTLANSVRDGSGSSVNVSDIIADAKAKKRHIETATTLYREAVNLATEIERPVHAQGSHSFLVRYDALCNSLYSAELRSLLVDGKWETFCDIVRSFVNDFETLRADLSCYKDADEDDDEHVDIPATLTVEKACRILSVPPTATGDQIKKSYRMLCALWHPDKRLVNDDQQIKRIIEAYAFLQSEGHIGRVDAGGNHAKV